MRFSRRKSLTGFETAAVPVSGFLVTGLAAGGRASAEAEETGPDIAELETAAYPEFGRGAQAA
jgi:hypothetical protein